MARITDKQRLDWLESKKSGLMLWRGYFSENKSDAVDIHEPRDEGFDDACGELLGNGHTIRQAIDVAMRRAGCFKQDALTAYRQAFPEKEGV